MGIRRRALVLVHRLHLLLAEGKVDGHTAIALLILLLEHEELSVDLVWKTLDGGIAGGQGGGVADAVYVVHESRVLGLWWWLV